MPYSAGWEQCPRCKREETMTFSSFDDIMKWILDVENKEYYFRGFDDDKHLICTLGRKNHENIDIDSEFRLIKMFVKGLYGESKKEYTFYENISIMQHYGLPTRFVDITSDIRIALFFGLGRSNVYPKRFRIAILPKARLIMSKPLEYNIKFSDLEGLRMKDLVGVTLGECCKFDLNQMVKMDVLESKYYDKMYLSYFSNQKELTFLPYKENNLNNRLIKQSGMFLTMRDLSKPIPINQVETVEFNLDEQEGEKLRTYLKNLNYTSDNLFYATDNDAKLEELCENIKKGFK